MNKYTQCTKCEYAAQRIKRYHVSETVSISRLCVDFILWLEWCEMMGKDVQYSCSVQFILYVHTNVFLPSWVHIFNIFAHWKPTVNTIAWNKNGTTSFLCHIKLTCGWKYTSVDIAYNSSLTFKVNLNCLLIQSSQVCVCVCVRGKKADWCTYKSEGSLWNPISNAAGFVTNGW